MVVHARRDICEAIVAQYIMYYHDLPLKNVINYLENIIGGQSIEFEDNLNEALKIFDAQRTNKRCLGER